MTSSIVCPICGWTLKHIRELEEIQGCDAHTLCAGDDWIREKEEEIAKVKSPDMEEDGT